MPYKEKVRLLQQIEEYKRPAEKSSDCQKFFEQYCEENNLTTPSQIAASAHNPMYYDYLLDYVGYSAGQKKDEFIEQVRSTYIRASGRFIMLKRVAEEYAKEKRCETRIVTPLCEFLPANLPNTTICRAEVRIEALFPGNMDWQIVYSGTGTAKRQGGGGYNDFYIEKAETAARARAIAAAGIGIDIHGGLSTIEDAQAAYEEEQAKPDTDERMKMQMIEARIKSCLTAEKPMEAIDKVAKSLKEDAKSLGSSAQTYLSNVFEEVLAKITQKNNGNS